MPDDTLNLDELERLLKAGAPTPWEDGSVPCLTEDRDLAVAAINALPRLIAIARAAQEWVDRVDEWLPTVNARPFDATLSAKASIAKQDAEVTLRAALRGETTP